MKNKLVLSLIIATTEFMVLSGCGDICSSIINEKPLNHIEKRYVPSPKKGITDNRIMLAQSEYTHFCDCFQIAEYDRIIKEDIEKLKQIEEDVMASIEENPRNVSEKIGLSTALILEKDLTSKRKSNRETGEHCRCYGASL